jgi:peroxiredoxin
MPDNPELSIGSLAPDFTLPAHTGGECSLHNYRSTGNIYLFFIREYT